MSLGEIAVIFFVAFLVLSPSDIKKLLQYIKKTKRCFLHIEHNVHRIVSQELSKIEDSKDDITSELHDINYYMKKIIDLGSAYQGSYDLDSVRNYYEKLISKNKSDFL